MIGRVFAVEAGKLARQPALRLIALLCLAGPFVFAAILHGQSSTPGDTLFGIGVHASGVAVALVVLGFSTSWALPLIAGVVAGDVFSAEDRHGTWETILVRSATREELLAGKLLAVAAGSLITLLLTALASVAAGLIFEGGHTLTGLGGSGIGAGHAVLLTLLGWALCVPPMLALSSLALLVSLVTRSGIAGVLAPSLLNLVFTLLAFVGSGVWVNTAVVTSGLASWHGLFTGHVFWTQLLVGLLVSAVWAGACLLAARRVLARRALSGEEPAGRRVPAAARAVLVVAVLALLALAQGIGPAGVTSSKLDRDVASVFDNLALLQQAAVGQSPAPVTAQAACRRRADTQKGPGDWSCVLDVLLPDTNGVTQQRSQITYDVSVQSNGCYRADSPPSFIGQASVRVDGRTVANPLYTFYGCLDIT